MVMQMFHRIQDDERFQDSVIFSDKSSKNPRFSMEHVRDRPKVNMFRALSKERVYCPFFM
jgi:hypothetical protein